MHVYILTVFVVVNMKALQWLCVSILFSVLTTTILAVGPLAESTEDNDFAEFEDIDEGTNVSIRIRVCLTVGLLWISTEHMIMMK